MFGYYICSLNKSVLHFLSTNSQYHFYVQHKLYTKYDLPLSYHLAETIFCARSLLPPSKLRKSRAQPYFRWAVSKPWRKIKLHTARFSMSTTCSSNSNSNRIRCKTKLLKSTKKLSLFPTVIITLVITTLMKAMYSKGPGIVFSKCEYLIGIAQWSMQKGREISNTHKVGESIRQNKYICIIKR